MVQGHFVSIYMYLCIVCILCSCAINSIYIIAIGRVSGLSPNGECDKADTLQIAMI